MIVVKMNEKDLSEKISRLKEEKNSVILAHNYQIEPVQLVADYLGDSLGLARKSAETDADIVVFAGVDFMAETASMLNPGKKILLPSKKAECPMAAMLSAEKIRVTKDENPDAATVIYVNTFVDARAEADVTCTSSNAVEIVNALEEDRVIFGPDRNLAWHVEQKTNKELIKIPEDGHCYVHRMFTSEDVIRLKEENPRAEVMVHPESDPEVQMRADHICSTGQMMARAGESDSREFIVGTEIGLVERLKREFPEKKFIPLSKDAVCEPMKRHTLEKVYKSLKDEVYEVKVPPKLAERAKKATERMLEMSD